MMHPMYLFLTMIMLYVRVNLSGHRNAPSYSNSAIAPLGGFIERPTPKTYPTLIADDDHCQSLYEYGRDATRHFDVWNLMFDSTLAKPTFASTSPLSLASEVDVNISTPCTVGRVFSNNSALDSLNYWTYRDVLGCAFVYVARLGIVSLVWTATQLNVVRQRWMIFCIDSALLLAYLILELLWLLTRPLGAVLVILDAFAGSMWLLVYGVHVIIDALRADLFRLQAWQSRIRSMILATIGELDAERTRQIAGETKNVDTGWGCFGQTDDVTNDAVKPQDLASMKTVPRVTGERYSQSAIVPVFAKRFKSKLE